MPKATFESFAAEFKYNWREFGYECDMKYGECRFNEKCSTIRESGKDFSFSAFVDGKEIRLDSDDMLISGSQVNV